MTIVNRRNAVIGWGVWKVMKSIGKKQKKGHDPKRKRKAGTLTGGGVVALAGALLLLEEEEEVRRIGLVARGFGFRRPGRRLSMSIVNRRNAILGWGMLKFGKYFAKRKVRSAGRR